MRRYELMLLFRPDLEDDKLQAAVEKVTRAIVGAGGALTKVSPWGKRRLAYDIKHFREASYFLIHFDIAPSEVRGIERGILITEEILRHLVTVLEEKALGRAAERLRKGHKVFAEGALRAREWEGKDGQKRTSLEIRFARVQSLERRDPGEGGGSFGDAGMDAPPAARPRGAEARPAAAEVEAIDVDDIPF